MRLRSLSFLPKIISIHTSRVGILVSNTDCLVLVSSIFYGGWHIESSTVQVISLHFTLLSKELTRIEEPCEGNIYRFWKYMLDY